MPHAKEHPLAHCIVVPHGCLLTGETVRVVDWLDRCGEAASVAVAPGASIMVRVDALWRFATEWGGSEPIPVAEAVAVIAWRRHGSRRGNIAGGLIILPATELPSYDPVPVGVIS